jgi:hypothetical protein
LQEEQIARIRDRFSRAYAEAQRLEDMLVSLAPTSAAPSRASASDRILYRLDEERRRKTQEKRRRRERREQERGAERQLLRDRVAGALVQYRQGETLASIANDYGVSRQRVHQWIETYDPEAIPLHKAKKREDRLFSSFREGGDCPTLPGVWFLGIAREVLCHLLQRMHGSRAGSSLPFVPYALGISPSGSSAIDR